MKVKATQFCLTLCDLMDLHTPCNSPGQNTGVGTLSLLQGIEPGSPALQADILYQLSHQETQ